MYIWLMELLGKDVVLLRTVSEQHIAKVRWHVERPYAAPKLPETMAELLPDGSVDGPSFVKSWKPLTSGINEWARRQLGVRDVDQEPSGYQPIGSPAGQPPKAM